MVAPRARKRSRQDFARRSGRTTRVGSSTVLTLYGGKLTTYRLMSERIGDQICSIFGVRGSAQETHGRGFLTINRMGQLAMKLSSPDSVTKMVLAIHLGV